MSELGPAARALLEVARDAGPDPDAIRRMRLKIDAGVAAGTTAGGVVLATKLGAVVLVGALAVGAIVYSRGESAPPNARAVAPAESAAPNARAVAPAESAPPPPNARAATPAAPRAPAAVQTPAATPAHIEMTPMPARPAPRKVELAREVELVDRAMAALRDGDARGALAAVRAHAAETAGAGQLAEDAAAIEIEALCSLRDPKAAARLAAFDARWRSSAQRARLSKACR